MKVFIVILLMVLITLAGCGSSYISPVDTTALYEIGTKGFIGTAILTDNYTITNDYIILHGYSNRDIDMQSSRDLLIPKEDILFIQANPRRIIE